MDASQNSGFDLEKQRAIERMRELNARSKNIKNKGEHPPPQNKNTDGSFKRSSDFLSDFKLPVLGNIGADSDISLILGLVLILTAEKSDKLLLLALIYILL